jgi:hypothetical protein
MKALDGRGRSSSKGGSGSGGNIVGVYGGGGAFKRLLRT